MAAGMVLGPVVMGALFPSLRHQVFGESSLAGLSELSTVGLVLFMFIVGLEMRSVRGIAHQIKSAGYVGVLSVAAALVLGVAIAPALHPMLAPPGWPTVLLAFLLLTT